MPYTRNESLAFSAMRYALGTCVVTNNLSDAINGRGHSIVASTTSAERHADRFTDLKCRLIYRGKNCSIQWHKKKSASGDNQQYSWQPEIIDSNDVILSLDNINKDKNHVIGITDTIARAYEYRCGSCDAMSLIACDYLLKQNAPFFEIIGIGGKHTFVVVGRVNNDEGSVLQDFDEWGEDAWICDPWLKICCKAKDIYAEWEKTINEWEKIHRLIYDSTLESWVPAADWRDLISTGTIEVDDKYYGTLDDEKAPALLEQTSSSYGKQPTKNIATESSLPQALWELSDDEVESQTAIDSLSSEKSPDDTLLFGQKSK